MRRNCLAALIVGSSLALGHAQLAITEVMPSASLTFGTNVLPQTSDWWELSNFGTNAIDLTGYKWNDNAGGLIGADPAPFQGLIILPGESILLVESNTGPANISTNIEQFRTFWGLGPNVRIRMYTGNGLGSGGDGVRFWAPSAASDADVVDSVDFGAALRGSTFIYNTNTGLFAVANEYSTNGVNGAFKAAQSDDIGSPGTNTGPVALSIGQHPPNLSVNPGDNATFSVGVLGIPRPRFQWKFNGADINGATLPSLTVSNVQISKTGLYSVVIFNGFNMLASSNGVLLLNAAPEAPSVQTPPADQTIYIGQSATFTVIASGVPQPRYQWRFNGTPLGNATNNSYTVSSAVAGSSGIYSVVISNTLGILTNQAMLTVTPRPNLVITEVSSSQSTNGDFSGHNDWWELSNFDTFAVDLYHYQFDDNSALRAAAYTITNHIVIAPGESIVFVEAMSPNSFRRWWGAMNLKPDLQIIRYDGPNLSFSGTDGDGLLLWNPGAADDSDAIAVETFVSATTTSTFGYNPDTSTFGDLSGLGVFGAFRAMETDDVGSPGYIRTPPEPRILRVVPAGGGYRLIWYGFSNRTYAVEFKNDLSDATWSPLMNALATNVISTVDVPAGSPATGRRLFRFSLQP